MRLTGLARVALLALIWGSGFLWIKVSLRGFSPVQLTFGRLALGALVLVAVLWFTKEALPHGRPVWLHLTGAALLGNAIPYLLFGIAEQSVDSNLAGAVNATTPLWTVLFALAARTEKRLSPPQVTGMLLGFVGVLVMLAPWQSGGSLAGTLECLAASASYGASYVYIGKYLSDLHLPALVLSAGQLIAASGLLLVTSPFGGFDAPNWRADAVIGLLVLGAVGTGLAYVLNYRIISDDGPILASTVTYLLPVVAVVLGVVALGESMDARVVVGVIVVLAGVVLTRRSGPAKREPNPSTVAKHHERS
jgi:drug/metabolite transporter (DMT)-like permease